MIDKMQTTKPMLHGQYSLIQFCPDAARLEVANIGVALFCWHMNCFYALLKDGSIFRNRSHTLFQILQSSDS